LTSSPIRNNEYTSNTFTALPLASSGANYFQQVWARFFGQFMQSARDKVGLSVENAAELAGMDARNWLAMESGAWLPATRQQLQFIAAALDIDWAAMTRIVAMCRQAWGL
jgi:hypothetical protein